MYYSKYTGNKIDDTIDVVDKHILQTNNPHKVTTEQINAVPVSGGVLTGNITIENSNPVYFLKNKDGKIYYTSIYGTGDSAYYDLGTFINGAPPIQ